MKSDNELTPDQCKAIVLAILVAIEKGDHDVAAEIAGLAADPAKVREIIG